MLKWENERKIKQDTSSKQTDALINKITNLRETLGLIKDDINTSKRSKKSQDSLRGDNDQLKKYENIEKQLSTESQKQTNIEKIDPDLRKLLEENENRQNSNRISEQKEEYPQDNCITIKEHETIVREEIAKVENYFKDIIAQTENEYEAKIKLLREEYEDKLRFSKDEQNIINVFFNSNTIY